jgi:hypothetical protein
MSARWPNTSSLPMNFWNQARLPRRTPSPASLLFALLPLCVWQAATHASEPAKLASSALAVPDPRHISNGWNIPSEGGAIRDQPACSMMGQAADTAAVQSLRTGQPACDLDTAKLVEWL